MVNQHLISLGNLILTVGIALAGFILAQARTTRSKLQHIRNQLGKLRESMAHLEAWPAALLLGDRAQCAGLPVCNTVLAMGVAGRSSSPRRLMRESQASHLLQSGEQG